MTAWLIHERLCAGIQKRNCCKICGKVLLHPLRLLTQHARRSAVSLASPADQRTVTLVASPFHLQVHRNAIPLVESIWRELVCGVAESYESSVDSSEEQPHSVQSRETLGVQGENREKSGEKLGVEERENSRLTEVRGMESAAFVVTDLLLAGYEPLLCILDDLVILTSKIV